MSSNNAVVSRAIPGIILAALIAVFGLASCGGGGSSSSIKSQNPVIPTGTPTVTLTADSTSIAYNASATITWSSTNSTSCSSSSGTGGTGTSGSFSTGALTATTTYTVTCTSSTGATASKSITITVGSANAPTVTLSAASTSIASGASTTITWSSTNSTSCSSSSGTGGTGTSGSFSTGALTATTTYTVTCTSSTGATASKSITITVGSANAPTVTLSAGLTAIAYNASTTVTWSSTNSTSCSSSSGTGGTGTSGSFPTGNLTATTAYTVTCTGASGSASKSITITVAPSAITAVSNTGGTGNVTFTSANNLTAGAIITISGTTNYDGTYTVVSATSTSFVIAHAFTAETFTSASWQLAGGMISGCLTSGATGVITLPTTFPSRFTGVAPLSVFFDAAGTTATTTTRPFHDLEYRWDFGDPAGSPVSGTTWSVGSKPGVSSRNAAIGAEAGHVYETTGPHTVTLTVTDGTNTVTNSCALIVVQDPDAVFAGTNTICFSTSANYTDCPVGAAHVQTSNSATAISNNQNANRRLLFRRGETFTGSTSGIINSNGPGIVGAYGTSTDAKPYLIGPGTRSVIELARGSNGDWRIMDLALNGQSSQDGFNVGVGATGPFNQATLLRLDISGVSSGIAASHWTLVPGDASFDKWAVQDSTVTGIPGCNWEAHYICNWRMYIVGTRWSIQGNYLDGQSNPAGNFSGGSHVFRSEYLANSILSNNTIAGAGFFQHNIKLHAWAWGGGAGGNATAGVYSEKIIIADNKIVGGINPWTVSLGPQDEINDERVRDVIFERNWITSGSGSQIGIEDSAAESTFRNNILDMTGAAWHAGIHIGRRGIEPTPNNVHVYNNTIYSGSTGDYIGIEILTATTTIVRNNLGSAPSATYTPVMFTDSGSGSVLTNNLLNNTPSALFGITPPIPASPANFGLKSLPNPARDTGFSGTGLSSVQVLSDFFLTTRPQNGVIDIGAAEGL